MLDGDNALRGLRDMVDRRMSLHRRQLIYNAIGIPVTAPLMIVPVIPNIPMYYFMWRAWSHWRALSSARYLQGLLQHDSIVPSTDPAMAEIFARNQNDMPQELRSLPQAGAIADKFDFVLCTEQLKQIVKLYGLNEQAANDLGRAQQQGVRYVRKECEGASRDNSAR